MQTPSKNSISSFSVQASVYRPATGLVKPTCARPGQATHPDNMVLHTSRSHQGGRVGNRRAVVSLSTGCHSEAGCWHCSGLIGFLGKSRDADNGGREQRQAATQHRLCFQQQCTDTVTTLATTHDFRCICIT